MKIARFLHDEGIEKIVFMPDSLMTKCIEINDFQDYGIELVQVLNESDAVCICSGLNLSGTKSICMMENSGIRSACDIISRFELAHGIHNIFILTNRGNLGEENWWGIYHKEVTDEILKLTHMKTVLVKNENDFKQAIHNSVKTLKTEQASIAILLEYSFFGG